MVMKPCIGCGLLQQVRPRACAATFGKAYKGDEMSKHKGIYNTAISEIEAHNAKLAAGHETYQQGVNQFTDLTL